MADREENLQNLKVFFGTFAVCASAIIFGLYITSSPGDNFFSGKPATPALAEANKPNASRAPNKSAQRQSQSTGGATTTSVELPTATGPRPRYLDAKWDAIHFKPAIDKATNAQCLVCHHEIVTHKVRENAPAGLKSSQAKAWYQTLDTYAGSQDTFHDRHLSTPFAKQVMNLKCNFCHQGHDPREEATKSSATSIALGDFAMRKTVNPEKSCLMCHGNFPAATMGLEGSWAELREGLEDEETKNGCLTCHEELFRTVRHKVNYLNAKAIEDLAKKGTSDVCLGCHGGRAWFRVSYPYPRHPWPDMPEETPDWAKKRPTVSAPEHRLSAE